MFWAPLSAAAASDKDEKSQEVILNKEAELSTQAAGAEDKDEKSQEVMNQAEVSTQADAATEDKDEKSQEALRPNHPCCPRPLAHV